MSYFDFEKIPCPSGSLTYTRPFRVGEAETASVQIILDTALSAAFRLQGCNVTHAMLSASDAHTSSPPPPENKYWFTYGSGSADIPNSTGSANVAGGQHYLVDFSGLGSRFVRLQVDCTAARDATAKPALIGATASFVWHGKA